MPVKCWNKELHFNTVYIFFIFYWGGFCVFGRNFEKMGISQGNVYSGTKEN